jgi:cobalt transporter subunit CbtA
MLTRIATTALFAGFLTGLIAAVLHFLMIQPLLLHAELFENGTLVHFGIASSAGTSIPELPAFDSKRNGLSTLFFALTYTGHSFLLTAAIATAAELGHEFSIKAGLIWGLAGFFALHLAPAVGLPPELPGSAAADLASRQVWWFGTVAATALGLWFIAFGKSPFAWGGAVAVIALPHIIGAPHTHLLTGPVPPELAAQFAARTLGVGLVCWALLGLFVTHFWKSEG